MATTMKPEILRLPDGQTFAIRPVFGGFNISTNEIHNNRPKLLNSGWFVNIHTEDDVAQRLNGLSIDSHSDDTNGTGDSEDSHLLKFKKPTLQHDVLFISSIVSPSSDDYTPPSSTSRHVAMLLWITLYWYFQQLEPSPSLETAESSQTPAAAKPKGEWRIRIKRDGVLKTRNIIPKLERMGMITTMDSAVGTGTGDNEEGWEDMFVTRQSFWQIPFGLFLFTLQPKRPTSHPGSPMSSRPNSPVSSEFSHQRERSSQGLGFSMLTDGASHFSGSSTPTPLGPYFSASRQPTYYPPPPLKYIFSNGVRHPLRPKPPRMGEIFYTRFVPSVGRYLSFRVASSSNKPVPYLGPVGPLEREHTHRMTFNDLDLLHIWLENLRVKAFWGGYHSDFLSNSLKSKHSFPVIGMWDGVPFGYFEIYWVKEDPLGRQMGRDVEDWDRGLHVLVGEEWARGKVTSWLSSLVHWCWQADNRTANVCLEPRIDNEKFLAHLQQAGFSKDRQITFPHKQAWLMRLRREVWEGPAF